MKNTKYPVEPINMIATKYCGNNDRIKEKPVKGMSNDNRPCLSKILML